MINLSNWKLNSIIALGFSSVLFLVIIVSLAGILGLSTSKTNFVEYQDLANDNALASKLETEMLAMRVSALKYVDTHNKIYQSEFEQHRDNLKRLFDSARQSITSPERVELVNQSAESFQNYVTGFNQAAQLIIKRDEIVADSIEPLGLSLRQSLTKLIDAINPGSTTSISLSNIQNMTLSNIPKIEIESSSESISDIKDDKYNAIYYAAKVQESLLLGRLYITRFLLTNDVSDYERALLELNTHLVKFKQQLLNSVDTAALSHHKAIIVGFDKDFNVLMSALENTHQLIVQRNNIVKTKMDVSGDALVNYLDTIRAKIEEDYQALGKTSLAKISQLKLTVIIISTLCLTVGVFATLILPKFIKRPIGGEPRDIAGIMKKIADGDLSFNIKDALGGRLTGIAESVLNMKQALSELIKGIRKTTDELVDSADESARVAASTSNAINEQNARINLVVSAVEQMSVSLASTVEQSEESASEAISAKQQVHEGKNAVEETITSIKTLEQKLSQAIKVIYSLEKNSNNIETVLEVIKGISEQTNLLALNAAIEAARAGEQGRGFAVVADEVRSLAQRTQESATEINAMIEALQTGTKAAVDVIEVSGQDALQTVERSEQTGQLLEHILSTVVNIAQRSETTAIAIKEQSVVTQDINQNITAISDAAQLAANESQKAADTSQVQNKLVHQLNQLASGFKLS